MTMQWPKTIGVAAALAGMVIFGCASIVTMGPGSETVAVAGQVVDSLGRPVPRARVMLLPAAYNPFTDRAIADSMRAITDTTGHYSIKAPGPGAYCIEAADSVSKCKALVTGITIDGKDTVLVSQSVLRLPGTLMVVLQDSAFEEAGYIYLPGTSCFAHIHNGVALVETVAAGVVTSVNYANTSAPAKDHIIQTNVTVQSNNTLVVADIALWKYSKRLHLNTTAAGANIGSAVDDVPILVRLTSGTFDFSQAQGRGEDVRFAKSNGAALPYEIKRWDAAGKIAEIWVKMDTVYGNDSMQSIMMYWGNTTVAGTSNGPAVFDSASGFEGVWHLGETSGTRAPDASRNRLLGTYQGGLPRGESGPIGICQNIARPDSDFVDMGNVLNPGLKNISVGVWVKRAALGSPQALIAKSNGDTPSDSFGYLLSFDPYNFPHFHVASGGARWGDDSAFEMTSNLAVTDTTSWHYVFVIIDRSDNNRCKMYVDGIDRTGPIGGNIAHVTEVTNTLNVHIGTESDNNCSYKGSIGEATIAFTARSADWVKVSYMNQKAPDALIKW